MSTSLIETPLEKKGTRKSKEYISQVRVIYADTDKMGHVYHSKYLHYFEIGRNELLREIGFPYKKLEDLNIFLPIIESHLNYYRPAFYDDLLTVKTNVGQEEGKLLRFNICCSVYRENELLTDGYTIHVISSNQGKPSKPPKELYRSLTSKLFG
ncbi:MAG: thioesterase family protein [Candidatus Caenarcaniphilales bacterium]|nr:thioesterase family protein [Candidatus Caenarcaniphilales bacterium]